MRGYDYLSFVGSRAAFFNAELRFPFIEAMLTPIGVLGGIAASCSEIWEARNSTISRA
jgi:hypothetical protein